MSCGLIDLGCQIHGFIDPIWGYIVTAFYVVISLIALGVLGYIYKTFGWKGVVVALTLGVAGFIYKSGYDRGKDGQSFNPVDRTKPTPPAKPKKPKSPHTIVLDDPDFSPPPYFDPTQADRKGKN